MREQQAGAAGLLVGAPPGVEGVADFGLRGPSENGQAKSGFGYEGIAGQQLERGARRIGRELIIAGDDPHFAGTLDAHLSGAEDVARGVKGDTRLPEREGLAVMERL